MRSQRSKKKLRHNPLWQTWKELREQVHREVANRTLRDVEGFSWSGIGEPLLIKLEEKIEEEL